MKYLKILGLAAVAAMALMAFAGTASATVLCNNNASTTACSSKVAAGAHITGEAGGTSTLETTGGTVLVTCKKADLTGEVKSAGGSAATVSGPIKTLDFTECSKPVTTLVNGELEVHHIAGTDNGTVTAKNTQVTIAGLFNNESCIYGAGNGLDLGTLVGGAPATLTVNTLVPRQLGSGAFCPAEARWTSSFKVTAPNPLYVAAA